MAPLEITPELFLVPLEQPLAGFREFITTWIYRGEPPFVVDVGPAHTVDRLAEAMEALGIDRPAAILLTHIHIDHAGGTGDLLARYPETPVVCHPKGIRHLADPEKLWAGSLKTLGATAEAYGPIRPVPERLLRPAEAPFPLGDGKTIRPAPTPGHAPHHVSFLFEEILFGGEAGGVHLPLPDGGVYLRPATPPRFFLETSIESLDTLIDIPHEIYCYGHFGATTRTPELLRAHRDQLQRWADIIETERGRSQAPDPTEHCIDVLLETDPLMARWPDLAPEVRQRERGFLRNSVAGFLGYLAEKKNR